MALEDRLLVRVPQWIGEEVRAEAERLECSVSFIVRTMLRDYISQRRMTRNNRSAQPPQNER